MASSSTAIDGLPLEDAGNGMSQVVGCKLESTSGAHALHQIGTPTINIFHRTCRGFFLTAEVDLLLFEYSGGRYNAQMYLLNDRIREFLALVVLSKR